ncbi:MAG: hypothetical protein EOP36_01630 [Rubrivivax sp.]|nr:MAG: hypothetical protein EOP36_01630 [Rubrivivax sp.]
MLCEDLYAITPLTSGGQKGWLVTVQRQGVPYRKCFTVYRHGSTQAALQAAIAWRDQLVRTVKPMSLADYSNLERRNNTSGYPGVYMMRTIKKGKSGEERIHLAWEARSPTGLKPSQKKSFAIQKHGDARAYELAVEARQAFVAQLDGYLQRRVPEPLREQVTCTSSG